MDVTTVDQIIIDWFLSLGTIGHLLLVFVSLFCAAFFAGIIGFEREYHGHAAGLRTHMLVSVGSALIMVISIYGFKSSDFPNRDPARLAAQVISGIGFLGAGTIIQTGTDIKGLTTATTLWLVMAIGLAAGAGQIVISFIATIGSLLILISLRRIEHIAQKRAPKITIVVKSDTNVLSDLHIIASRFGINIRDIESQLLSINNGTYLRVTLSLAFASKATVTAFTEELKDEIKPLEIRVSSNA